MFGSKRGPDERRNEAARQDQYDRDAKKLKAGDAKAERLNQLHQQRVKDARREGR